MSDTPPNDIDAEFATVGAMLVDNTIITDVFSEVSAVDFYNPHTARMFREIGALFQNGEPVDAVSLGRRLGENFVLLIGQALEKTPHAKNAAYYAGIVKELAERRRLIAD